MKISAASFSNTNPAISNTAANFLLHDNQGLRLINRNNIIRIQAYSNYSKLYFEGGKTVMLAKILSHFDDKLAGLDFIRIHRSHLINLRYLKEISLQDSAKVILSNGDQLAISRRKMPNLLKRLKTEYVNIMAPGYA